MRGLGRKCAGMLGGLIGLSGLVFSVWADFSYRPGLLIYQAQVGGVASDAGLRQTVALGLPQPVRPDLRLVRAEWVQGQPVQEVRCQLQGMPGMEPERYRDLYLISLSLENCPELRRAEYAVQLPIGLAAQDVRTLAGPEESPAEKALARMIVNHAESRQFRSRRRVESQMAQMGAAKVGLSQNGLAKSGLTPTALAKSGVASVMASLPARRLTVFTESEGIHVLTYAALQEARVPVDQIEVSRLRLWRLNRANGPEEVPIFISGDHDGRLNAGDAIEFLGARPKGEISYHSPYTREAVFVLTWEGAGTGLRAPLTPAALRTAARAVPAVFNAAYHAENDFEVLRAFSTAEENITDLGDRVMEQPQSEFWYWQRQGPEKDQLTVTFTLPYHPVLVGAGESQDRSLRVRVQMKGITNDAKADPDHHVRFFLNGKDISLTDGQVNDAIWEGQATYTWVSVPLGIGALKAGVNELTVQKVNDLKTNEGRPVEVQDAYLNWVQVEFPARFRAQEGRLFFGNRFKDSLGLRTFALQGFQSDSIAVWDTRGRRLHGLDLRREAEGFTARFADSLIAAVDYHASEYARRIEPRLRFDTLPDLRNPTQGADWICITAPELLGRGMDSLVAHRKSQGLRTAVVLAQHIYQAFGDGTPNPEALRDFVQHAYAHWPRPAPTYLLLAGETSLYQDKMRAEGRPNLVPTRLIDIRGWGVAANDDYFAKVAGADEIPDLMVGRLPVATREALSHVVHKMLRHEKERDAGAWSNKTLLIGGYETAFSSGNALFQARALSLGRHVDRMDLFTSSPYYRNLEGRRHFYRQLDSGLAYVQFFGHGGGSVWSDAGLLTMDALDKDSLRGDFAVPFIASVTCLTGYFEDPLERSLGEEMLRRPRNGAVAFYGASGYISTAAGRALGDELTAVALRPGKTTVGAVVQEAEWRVRQKTGSAFLPILAEFNLLGDPAMTYRMPEVKTGLQVDPVFLRTQAGSGTGGTSGGEQEAKLNLQGRMPTLNDAEAVVQIAQSDSVWRMGSGTVSGRQFQGEYAVKAPAVWAAGQATVHAFADTVSEVIMGHFAAADWWVDSVTMTPASATYGDSVHIRFVLRTPYDSARFENGLALFALGQADGTDASVPPIFENADQRLLVLREDGRIETAMPIVIPTPVAGSTPLPYLHVKMRLGMRVMGNGAPTGGALTVDETRTHAFALKPRPRLSLRPQAITLPWQDSVGAVVHFQNTGPGEARNFKVTVTSLLPDTFFVYEKTLPGPLRFGQADSVFIALPDSALLRRLKVDLGPENSADAVAGALTADTLPAIRTTLLDPGESWSADSTALVLAAASANAGPMRVFVQVKSMPVLPGHLQAPAPGDGLGNWPQHAYRVGTGSPLSAARQFSLQRGGMQGGNQGEGLAGSAPAWHWQPASTLPVVSANGVSAKNAWLQLDSGASPEVRYAGEGLYAYLVNTDTERPSATFQSRGQTLWPDDFVPMNTPIDIILQDAHGLDLMRKPPVLKSRGRNLDSSEMVSEAVQGIPTLARLRFMPKRASGANAGRDTLDLTAYDASGNVLEQSFAYRLGEKLAIRNLGSYPNPFADSAIFAYTLTDYCERVSLQVYSRSGRKVRSLSDDRAVGYREVVWDGKTDQGAAIANGLYFLKVTARSGDRTETSLFKLFKKRRR